MTRASYERRKRVLREKNLKKAIKKGLVRRIAKEELVGLMGKAKDKVNFIPR